MWPGKIEGNQLNPEAFPHRVTLDQWDWWKGPINTLSRPFLKLSTSSVGLSEKLQQTLYLSQQENCFTGSTCPTLSEKPPWTESPCFLTSVFYFFPSFDTSRPYWQHPDCPRRFKSFQVTCQIFSFTLVLCSPVAKVSRSLPAALCRPLVFASATGMPLLSVAAVAGSSGPHGGTQFDYTLSKRTEEDNTKPSPSCLDGNPTPAGLCETSQHRKATDYGLQCHPIFRTLMSLATGPPLLQGRDPHNKSQNISIVQ